MKIAMSSSHGGYGSERVPLGGGAAVFERLLTEPCFHQHELHLFGPGPNPPPHGIYHRVADEKRAPSALSMLEYARFSTNFGKATTEKVLELKPDILICHDISEGPNVPVLHRAGIPVITIFHVDVVDIFTRLYLGGLVAPERLAGLYRKSRNLPWPEVLKLVLQKQQDVMDFGAAAVVPSAGAAGLLRRCYPYSPTTLETVGWGAPEPRFAQKQIEQEAERLRDHHRIPAHHKVLLTLSRLSPEKAQHRLLEAALWAEKRGELPTETTIVIAGAPAFMKGESHAKRLHKLAGSLRTRVIFPGHVGGVEKAAWYSLATLFVVNSLHESYGLTTLEAMQQGCPVVAIRSFGTADTVSQDVGRLIPPGPVLSPRLWGTVSYLLDPSRSSLLKSMGTRARERASEATFGQAAERLSLLIESVHTNYYS